MSKQQQLRFLKNKSKQDFPGGTVDGSLLANSGSMNSIPGPEAFHMLQTGPMHHNYRACMVKLLKLTCLEPALLNKRSHCNEEEPLFAATKESPHTAMKTQSNQKFKKRKSSKQMISTVAKNLASEIILLLKELFLVSKHYISTKVTTFTYSTGIFCTSNI